MGDFHEQETLGEYKVLRSLTYHKIHMRLWDFITISLRFKVVTF